MGDGAMPAVEVIVALIILLFQTYFFHQTYRRTQRLRRIFTDFDGVETMTLDLPVEEASAKSVEELMTAAREQRRARGAALPGPWPPGDGSRERLLFLDLPSLKATPWHARLITAVNRYAYRNRRNGVEFAYIKDIVDAEVDSLEQQITLTLPVPLYIGLMGTMIGIILGLFGIDLGTLMSPEAGLAGRGIEGLLGGVKIAMLASAYGLLLTILNAGVFFRRAKAEAESRRGRFYEFIQTEFIPHYGRRNAAELEALQQNLAGFLRTFGGHIERLSAVMDTSLSVARHQKEVYDSLQGVKIHEIAEGNAKMLKELKKALPQLENFGVFLGQINGLGDASLALTTSLNEGLLRTSQFAGWLEKANQTAELSRRLLEFLRDHFGELESRRQLINDAIVRTDDVLSESLQALRERITRNIEGFEKLTADVDDRLQESARHLERHTQEKIEAIRRITVSQEDLVTKISEENLGNLSELKRLGELTDLFSRHLTASAGENRELLLALGGLDQRMAVLTELIRSSVERKNGFGRRLGALFK